MAINHDENIVLKMAGSTLLIYIRFILGLACFFSACLTPELGSDLTTGDNPQVVAKRKNLIHCCFQIS